MTDKRYLLAENTIDAADIQDLVGWLQTGPDGKPGVPWLTQGPLVREFEKQWAAAVGTKFACFVNSGSSANLVMYYGLLQAGKLKNKKIIVPAVSWATTVAPAMQLGFEPIMCDAEEQTFGIDPNELERLIKKHDPGAVCVVHVLGCPAQLDAMGALQKKHGFALMEDACAATGSRFGGKHVGTFGEASTFSFFFGHHMSTIEGGMVCTDDEALADLLIQIRAHGWGKDLPPEKEARLAEARRPVPFNRPFTFYVPGFNVRSSDLNARIGLSQMKKMERVVARRVENHLVYQKKLGDAGWTVQRNERAAICSISFATMAKSQEHRDKIAAALRAANVETRPLGGGNMSRQPFWADVHGETPMPVADKLHTHAFHLPNHPGLSTADIAFIADTVLAVKER